MKTNKAFFKKRFIKVLCIAGVLLIAAIITVFVVRYARQGLPFKISDTITVYSPVKDVSFTLDINIRRVYSEGDFVWQGTVTFNGKEFQITSSDSLKDHREDSFGFMDFYTYPEIKTDIGVITRKVDGTVIYECQVFASDLVPIGTYYGDAASSEDAMDIYESITGEKARYFLIE